MTGEPITPWAEYQRARWATFADPLRPFGTDEEPWSAVALPAKGWSANWLNDPKVWLLAALAYTAVVIVAMWRYINR